MDPFATHLAPLTRAALKADGPILELGCGDYSTPVLSAIAAHLGVPLIVLTSSGEWGRKFEDIADVRYVDWDDVDLPKADVVFLDNEQTTRDRNKLFPAIAKTGARIVAIHDFTNIAVRAGWPEARRMWRNLDVYDRYENQTGVLWN